MIMALDNAKDLIKTYEEHIKLYRNIIPLAGIHFINLEEYKWRSNFSWSFI